jgi:Nif-specific regulatory protein
LDPAAVGLFEISQALLSPSTLDLALQAVVNSLQNRFGFLHPLVASCTPGTQARFLAGDWADLPDPMRQSAQAVVERVARTAQPVPAHRGCGTNPCEDCDPAHSTRLCHFLAVPVLRRDEVAGAIVVERRERHSNGRSSRDLEVLDLVARLIGQTLVFQDLVARDRLRLMEERRAAEKRFPTGGAEAEPRSVRGIVGESTAIQAVLRKIHIVAKSHLPVLLRGESGTGKELFAQAIHELSPRRDQPLVKLNCAALPETMLETELFGHEKGAFTGAVTQRKGRFELADGGTLFLDEIGEISPAFQAKLLRVLQEGEFERVGGSETLKVDVRLVAATNRDLEKAVREETFRSDLYFRLCVVPLVLAPLRERPEDIPLLAREFLKRFNETNGTELEFGDDALHLMRSCAYPGNIRELESCVRRTAAFAENSCIHADDFACRNDSCLSALLAPRPAEKPLAPPSSSGLVQLEAPPTRALEHEPEDSEFDVQVPLHEMILEDTPERRRLVDAMERAGWVQAKAARLLGLTPRQICYALRKHGIEIKRF